MWMCKMCTTPSILFCKAGGVYKDGCKVYQRTMALQVQVDKLEDEWHASVDPTMSDYVASAHSDVLQMLLNVEAAQCSFDIVKMSKKSRYLTRLISQDMTSRKEHMAVVMHDELRKMGGYLTMTDLMYKLMGKLDMEMITAVNVVTALSMARDIFGNKVLVIRDTHVHLAGLMDGEEIHDKWPSKLEKAMRNSETEVYTTEQCQQHISEAIRAP